MGSSLLLCATRSRSLHSGQSARPSAIQCLGAPSENLWQIGKQLPRNNGQMVPSLLSILLTRCGGKTLTISSLSDTNGHSFFLASTAPHAPLVHGEMEASIPLQHGLQVRRFRLFAPHHRFRRTFARGTHSEGRQRHPAGSHRLEPFAHNSHNFHRRQLPHGLPVVNKQLDDLLAARTG